MDWIDPRDRAPMGEPETIVDCGATVLLGLVVKASYRRTLGIVAVKCERVGDALWPVSLAIADTLAVDTSKVQSNPRRHADEREDGA